LSLLIIWPIIWGRKLLSWIISRFINLRWWNYMLFPINKRTKINYIWKLWNSGLLYNVENYEVELYHVLEIWGGEIIWFFQWTSRKNNYIPKLWNAVWELYNVENSPPRITKTWYNSTLQVSYDIHVYFKCTIYCIKNKFQKKVFFVILKLNFLQY